MIEYNIFRRHKKTPLLGCFPFILKLKAADIIPTGQYKNYQTFSNQQSRMQLKKSFRSIHIDLKESSGEKIPCICRYHTSQFGLSKSLQQ